LLTINSSAFELRFDFLKNFMCYLQSFFYCATCTVYFACVIHWPYLPVPMSVSHRVGLSRSFVCLSVFRHDTSTTDGARITELDVEMFHNESWKLIFILGWKGQSSRSRVI